MKFQKLFFLFFCSLLTACGGGSADNSQSNSEAGSSPIVNTPPKISLAFDKKVREGQTVTVKLSTKGDNKIKKVEWEQIHGPQVKIVSLTPYLVFIAPEPPFKIKSDRVVFTVKVSDVQGRSDSESFAIDIESVTDAPEIAIDAAPKSIEELESFTLKARASDKDGKIVKTEWSQISGTKVSDLPSYQLETKITTPLQGGTEPIVLKFEAIDNEGAKTSKKITIEHKQTQKIEDVVFEDNNFQACVLENAQNKKWTRSKQVRSLNCRDKNIISVDGIEQLVNLEWVNLILNKIEKIDLSRNKELRWVDLEGNKIKRFVANDLPNLTEIDFTNNPLEELDISGSKELSKLDLYLVALKSIDLTPFTQLQRLTLLPNSKNDIRTLDLSTLEELDSIALSNMPIEHIDFSQNRKLTQVAISSKVLKNIDVSVLPELSDLRVFDSKVSEIDLSHNPNLSWLLLGNNELTEINIDSNLKLEMLNVNRNPLTEATIQYLKRVESERKGLQILF